MSANITSVEFGKLGSTVKAILDPSDYYITLKQNSNGTYSIVFNLLTLSGTLYQDLSTVEASPDSTTITKVGNEVPSDIKITNVPDIIYTTTTVEELRDAITVTAYYPDGTYHAVKDYEVKGFDNRAPGNLDFELQYGEIQEHIGVKVEYPYIKTLVDVSVMDGEEIYSSYSDSWIRNRLDVIGLMTDGKLHSLNDSSDLLPVYSFSASDNLFTDKNHLEDGVMEVPITVTSTDWQGVAVSITDKIPVHQSTPQSVVDVSIPNNTDFIASIGASTDVATVTIKFADNQNMPKVVETGYSFSYIPLDDEGNEIKDPSTDKIIEYDTLDEIKKYLTAGSYHLKVTYTENGKSVNNMEDPNAVPITIKVERIVLLYPSISGEGESGSQSYSADYRKWTVNSYTNTAIEAVIQCNLHTGELASQCDARMVVDDSGDLPTATIQAKHVGVYTVSFKIKDDDAGMYKLGEPIDGNGTYNVIITAGVPEIYIDNGDSEEMFSWIYGQKDSDKENMSPPFAAVLKDGTKIVTEEVPFDQATLVFMKDQLSVTVNPGNDMPMLDAGKWTVTVTVPASTNLQGVTSQPLDFKVLQNSLTVTLDYSSLTYNGNWQQPKNSVNPQSDTEPTIPEGLIVTAGETSGINADTYTMTFSIDTSVYGSSNFKLSNTSAEWSIAKAIVAYPSISGEKTYNGGKQTWDVPDYIDTTNFVCTPTLHGQSTQDMELVPDDKGYCLSATESGTYTVTFSLKEFETGKTNYEWTDPEKVSGIQLTIAPAKLISDFKMSEGVSLVYGDVLESTDYVESYTGWMPNDGADDISTSIDSDYTSSSVPGTYHLYITSFESRNYTLPGFDNAGDEGLSVLTFTVGKAPLTITSAYVENITYGDQAPDTSDFIVEFKGFRNNEGYYDSNSSGINFSIGTAYDPDDANNNHAGSYPINIDVSGYNASNGKYFITVNIDSDDVLTVDRQGLTLDWSSPIRNYNAGNAPTFTVMVSGGNAFEGIAYDTPVWLKDGVPVTAFEVDEGYTLELTLTDAVSVNYQWVEWTGCDSNITDDRNTVTVEFSITLPQTEFKLMIQLTNDQRTYGTLNSSIIKNEIQNNGWNLDSISDESLKGLIQAQLQLGNFTLLFTGNGLSVSDAVSEASTLDANDNPYTMTVTVGGFNDRYVFAEMSLTVLPCQVSVDSISDFTESGRFVYKPGGQDIPVTIPNLNPTIKGDNTVKWMFSVSDPNGNKSTVGFEGSSGQVDIPVTNSGNYTVTVSVSSPEGNYEFTMIDSEFMIWVSKGSIRLDFSESEGYSDLKDMYVGTYNGDAGPKFGIPAAIGDDVKLNDVDWGFSYSGEKNLTWEKLMDLISNANEDDQNYTAGYSVENSNYSAIGTIKFHVDKAKLVYNVLVEGGTKDESGSWTLPYDSKEHKVSVTLKGVDNKLISSNITWSIDYTMSDYLEGVDSTSGLDSWNNLVLTNARTYVVTYSATVDNYVTEEKTIEIEITPLEIGSITLTNDGKTFTEGTSMTYGDDSALNGIPVTNYGAEWVWSFGIGDDTVGNQWSNLNQMFGVYSESGDYDFMNSGKYTVTYSVHDKGLNYKIHSSSFIVNIEQRKLTVSAPTITYGDSADELDLQSLVSNYAPGEVFADAFPNGQMFANYSDRDPAGSFNGRGEEYKLIIPEPVDNYSLDSQSVTFEVQRYTVTVHVSNQSTEYGIVPEDGLISHYEEGTTIPYGDEASKVYMLNLYRKGETESVSLDVAVQSVETYHIVGESEVNYSVNFVYDQQGYSKFDVGQRQLTAYIANTYKEFDGKEVTAKDIEKVLYLMDGDTRFYGDVVIGVTFYYCGNGTEPGTPEDQPMDTNPVDAGYYLVEVISDPNYNIDDKELFYQIQRAYYTVNGAPINPNFDTNGNIQPYQIKNETFDGYHVVVRVGGKLMEDTLVLATGADNSQLNVTYYLRTSEGDQEIEGIPKLTQCGTYNIVAKFTGSDNYYHISEREVTFKITQAENHWLDGKTLRIITLDSDGSLPSVYRYTDFEYTQAKTPDDVTSSFGNVEIRYYAVHGQSQTEIEEWNAFTMPVGQYRVVLSVATDENQNYQTLETSYTFSISYLGLNPSWKNQQMHYNGESIENILQGYNAKFMDAEVQTGSGFDADNGTMTETDVGTYTVLLTLTDPNCVWDANPDSDTISLSWEITDETMANRWVEIPSIRDWTYGTEQSQHYGDAQYGDETFTFYNVDDMDNPLAGKPIDAGNYVMVVEVGDVILDGVTYTGISAEVSFTIHPYRVSVPEIMSVKYTGEQIEVPYKDSKETFYGTEVTVYTVTSEPGTKIGDYTATLTLNNSGNFVWSDGSQGTKEVTWRIISGGVPTYADFAIDDGDEMYTGHRIEKNVICLRDGWNEGVHYTVTHTDNLNAGTATVTVSGTAVDATTGESTPWSLTFTFEIVKADPVLDFVNEGFTSYEDNGTFELRPYLSDEAGLSDLVWTSSDESVATVDENGIVTLRGLGTAEITATLPGSENWNEVHDSYELTVNETQTEIVVVPGPGGSGGSGDGGVIYIPTVIREDAGISDMTWLIILACVVVVMLALIWLLWNRRTEGDGA